MRWIAMACLSLVAFGCTQRPTIDWQLGSDQDAAWPDAAQEGALETDAGLAWRMRADASTSKRAQSNTGADAAAHMDGDASAIGAAPAAPATAGSSRGSSNTGQPEDSAGERADDAAEPTSESVQPEAYGSLVITELMADPKAFSDAEGEWIEVYNATDRDIDLASCTISSGRAAARAITGEALLAPGDYATVASSETPGFVASYVSALTLGNNTGVVEVSCQGVLMDRVAYDKSEGFPIAAGVSAALDPKHFDADDNDDPAVWCLAVDEYSGDHGSPGRANAACTAARSGDSQSEPAPARTESAGASPRAPSSSSSSSSSSSRASSSSSATSASQKPSTPAAPQLSYGALVISEIMADPKALSDAEGEWFEVYNATAQSIDLEGCTIDDGAGPRTVSESVRIASHAYAVIANTDQSAVRASLVAALSLTNSADTIELRCGGTLIDRVAYDKATGFPIAAGVAAMLDTAQLDADDNDAPGAWCLAASEYATDLGTPGRANGSCVRDGVAVEEGQAPSNDAPRESNDAASPPVMSDPPADAPEPLEYGALVITEIMADPSAHSDATGEWFELYNTTTRDIDLGGCSIGDGSSQPHVIAESLRVGPRSHVTIANSADPGFAPTLVSSISLTNSADVIELTCGGSLVDRVAYDKAAGFPLAAGAAASLDPSRLDADSNDAPDAWCLASVSYGSDLGSPGVANAACTTASSVGDDAPEASGAASGNSGTLSNGEAQPDDDTGGETSGASVEPSSGGEPAESEPPLEAAGEQDGSGAPVAEGALVITEIMADPQALSDAIGEWFELYNATSQTIDLTGCTIDDGSGTRRAIFEQVSVLPFQYVTIASSANPGFSATFDTTLSLTNAADTIELACNGAIVDRVAYDKSAGFPLMAGVAAMLDPTYLNAYDNDRPEAWCPATTPYTTDLGSPGMPNPPCQGVSFAAGTELSP